MISDLAERSAVHRRLALGILHVAFCTVSPPRASVDTPSGPTYVALKGMSATTDSRLTKSNSTASADSGARRDAGWTAIQHTADAGLEVWAPSLDELLRQAAYGMLDLVADRKGVRRRVTRHVRAAGHHVGELFVNWLSELNFQHQVHGELYAEVVVDEASETMVSGRAIGERLDATRHSLRSEVKGVTYHGLEVKRGLEGWRAKVLFDI